MTDPEAPSGYLKHEAGLRILIDRRPMALILLSRGARLAILAAIALGVGLLSQLPCPAGMGEQAAKAILVFAAAAAMWVTQVVPPAVTGIFAMAALPAAGVLPADRVYSLFGNKAVFFIIAALILASPMIRSGLATRAARAFLEKMGTSPPRLCVCILLLSAFFSFWMSEHAVAAMMFPVVAGISKSLSLKPSSGFAKNLFLSLSWGCIIGGIATFLGGARAPLAVGMLAAATGRTISFLDWMLASFPSVALLLILAAGLLSRATAGESSSLGAVKEQLRRDRMAQGKVSFREIGTFILTALTVFAWIVYGGSYGLATIGMCAVFAAFAFGLAKWKEVEEDVNWGIVLMYGGAIALGFALEESGASRWFVEAFFKNHSASPAAVLGGFILVSIVLTEVISNSAVIAVLMPVALALAGGASLGAEKLALAITLPAGLAFMLPLGTPAMAIAFSSGALTVKDSARTGAVLNLAGFFLILGSALFYWPLLGF